MFGAKEEIMLNLAGWLILWFFVAVSQNHDYISILGLVFFCGVFFGKYLRTLYEWVKPKF
jgi:hypothetical protein